MKNKLFLFVALCCSTLMVAQIETPQPSPHAKMQQKVGLTEVSLDYSRPSMNGRDIFGELLPYGKKWRTGANENTVVTFSTDVSIDGKELKAGSYALYTVPEKNKWRVMFYKNTQNWGLPENWDSGKVAASTSVKASELSKAVKSFTIAIDDLSFTGANLTIMWENTSVSIPFSVPTDKMVSANIDRVMNGPGSNDYYSAAVYYLQTDKDINKAKTWIDKAIDMSDNPQYFQLRKKAVIYAKAGDKKGAIKAAKKSMQLAKKEGNDDYVRMNKKSLKEWGAM